MVYVAKYKTVIVCPRFPSAGGDHNREYSFEASDDKAAERIAEEYKTKVKLQEEAWEDYGYVKSVTLEELLEVKIRKII